MSSEFSTSVSPTKAVEYNKLETIQELMQLLRSLAPAFRHLMCCLRTGALTSGSSRTNGKPGAYAPDDPPILPWDVFSIVNDVMTGPVLGKGGTVINRPPFVNKWNEGSYSHRSGTPQNAIKGSFSSTEDQASGSSRAVATLPSRHLALL